MRTVLTFPSSPLPHAEPGSNRHFSATRSIQYHKARRRLSSISSPYAFSGSGVSSGSYVKCAKFLAERCSSIGLSVQQFDLVAGKTIGTTHKTLLSFDNILHSYRDKTWTGPKAPITPLDVHTQNTFLIFNPSYSGHYDVVPCDMNNWTVPPFAGEIKDGKLYGRGTQDMKICLASYIEAMRKLVFI